LHTPNYNYNRIEQALTFIAKNFKQQPNLEAVAASVHLSSHHFNRLFTEWAGITPKKFLQYTSIQHAKMLLQQQQPTLFDVSFATGLSSTSRLHDLFVTIEGMTPAEFKNNGKGLQINYNFYTTQFGLLIIAATTKGVCHMAFAATEVLALQQVKNRCAPN
jgi:AraC family transcriptional regulator, regulatory protein of adaptative response / methylated-DNA-[protein]-cysteine methyltransferase